MPVDDLKQIVDNVYLQGAHAAFVQITKFYSKKMDKLDKKHYQVRSLRQMN